MDDRNRIDEVSQALAERDLEGGLHWLAGHFPGAVRFSTSLGKEDQVLTDAIWRAGLDIRVFTLDTGRLFEETYRLIDDVRQRYGQPLHVYHPRTDDVERLVTAEGMHSFRTSVEARRTCCGIRKVEPLGRALREARVWITGLRAAQSSHRQTLARASWDDDHGVVKVNPLAAWSEAQVDAYLAVHQVPVNPLHGAGFASIGCAPCTRAIGPDEDVRAGRWWWEASSKECGLHR